MNEASSQRVRSPRWLQAMYAVLLLAALSLVILVLQDVLTAVEPEGGELHHLFVFDLAWPVFLIAALATLIAGVATLVIGRLRSDARLTRYGVWAVAFLGWRTHHHHHRHGKPATPRRLNSPDPGRTCVSRRPSGSLLHASRPFKGVRALYHFGRSCDEGSRGRVNSKVPLPFPTDQPMTLSRSRSRHWPRIPTGSRRKTSALCTPGRSSASAADLSVRRCSTGRAARSVGYRPR